MNPSVTQIISPWQDFSRVRPEVMENAQWRGKEVHAACAAAALGLWIPDIPSVCDPYLQSFLLWFRPMVVEVVAVETRLHCPKYSYQGQLDLLCRIKGDIGLTLLDHKTPITHHKAWRLQLAAYRHLALQAWPNVNRIGSLQLSPEGKPAKLREYSGTQERDFAVFLNALSVFKFFRKE
jgi:hypothetical protein